MLLTEHDITGSAARTLREAAGLTQTAFWEPVGVKQSVGCRYESDISIPHAVRILLVATYIGGIKINAGTGDGVAELVRIGAIQSNFKAASALARKATRDLDSAAKDIGEARSMLASV